MGRLTCLLLAAFLPATRAVVSPHSACLGIAGVLTDRVLKEQRRDPLDFRHRLDEQGKRYGKVIDFKLSELRAIQLLEDLCTAASTRLVLGAAQGGPGGAAPAKLEWAAGGQWAPGMGQQEREHTQKSLENHCVGLVEEHEEAVVGALRASGADLAEVLCGARRRAGPQEL